MQTGQRDGWWRGAWAAVQDALFPPRCAGCRQAGALWCAACQASLEWLQPPLCPHCGRPQANDQVCALCRHAPATLTGIRSAAWFKGPLRQAIHAFKYSGQTALAVPLGHILEVGWANGNLPAEAIVPVPLHPARLRERGYNQAALLARRLALATRLPVVEEGLRRTRATAVQMTLGAAERKLNVAGAFEGAPGRLAGRRVVLIDDVCTTGATLEACSVALREAGAAAVWALTLARAV